VLCSCSHSWSGVRLLIVYAVKAYCSYLQQCVCSWPVFYSLHWWPCWWQRHGGKPRKINDVEFDSTGTNIESVTPISTNGESLSHITNQFTVVRLYHKATPEFQRRISYVIDSDGKTVQYTVVQYLFKKGVDVPVITPPHGNAKRDISSYQRTQKSL